MIKQSFLLLLAAVVLVNAAVLVPGNLAQAVRYNGPDSKLQQLTRIVNQLAAALLPSPNTEIKDTHDLDKRQSQVPKFKSSFH